MKKKYLSVLLIALLLLILSTLGLLAYAFFIHERANTKTITLLKKQIENPGNSEPDNSSFFIGTQEGLYKINGSIEKIYSASGVLKIVPSPKGIWTLTRNNILFSSDYKNFEPRSSGIRQKVIKTLDNAEVSLFRENELLKDLAIDPQNPNNLITAGMNGVYFTLDSGKHWTYVPSHSATNGIKSVGIYTWNNQVNLLFGHPYQGVFYKTIEQKNWNNISSGLSGQGGFHDEISSITVIPGEKNTPPTVDVAQNFNPTIFQVNFTQKKLVPIVSPKKIKPVELIESLQQTSSKSLLYVQNDGVKLFNPKTKEITNWVKIKDFILKFQNLYKTKIHSIATFLDEKPLYSLSELWMLSPYSFNEYQKKASSKRGIYVQTDVLRSKKRFEDTLNIMKSTHLNMMVVDMKDDFGYLRFSHHNNLLSEEGIVKNPLNLPKTLSILKKQGIYVVGRIPVFKDAVLYRYQDGTWAVKDKTTGNSWQGLKKSSKGGFIPTREHWVDPYNENVWKYNIAIAKELIKQGIDEIQFDYIRFPTDGVNLNNASFPSMAEGMDKESALISFLRFARAQIKAPISVDIYGANGWMRTGARTGQDVELLSLYTDVIAPMYYPSHFGNTFLNFPPYEERPFRIYNLGSYRNYYIARGRSIIRPYVQAFILINNSYDKKYYGPAYINDQIKGITESIDLGYTFWNSSTKYSILYSSILNDKKE